MTLHMAGGLGGYFQETNGSESLHPHCAGLCGILKAVTFSLWR